MAEYKVNYKPSVDKDFKSIPDAELKKIVQRIQSLANNPRPLGCKKLTEQDKYRLRQGDYRILYTIDDSAQIVRIMKVGHRKDIYKLSEEKEKFTTDKS
ncbi:MAG: type II toxin-antitoxin system RelE family toxin [Dehalococcoidales bacterium]